MDLDDKYKLHLAAEYGNLEIIKSFIWEGVDVNTRKKNGATPLHYAVEYGNIKVVKFLIKNGADIDAQALYGLAPIHLGIARNHNDIVKFLVKKGANINLPIKEKIEMGGRSFPKESSPLTMAQINGNMEIVRLLEKHGAHNPNDLLLRSVFSGESNRVIDAIREGADVNFKDQRSFAPIHHAVELNRLEISGILIESGAEVDIIDKNGVTPMHLAAMYGWYDIARLLINQRALINQKTILGYKDKNGEFWPAKITPFKIATDSGHRELAELLKDHGGFYQ